MTRQSQPSISVKIAWPEYLIHLQNMAKSTKELVTDTQTTSPEVIREHLNKWKNARKRLFPQGS